MKKFLPVIILAACMIPLYLSASPNHGPVIKAFYAPCGAGSYLVPHDNAINGGGSGLTSGSNSTDDNLFKSLTGFSISCGYFYDWFQGEISYSGIDTENQYVARVSTPENKYLSDASSRNTEIRGGYRFSNPGDTSYQWLYLGIRKSNLEIPYNNTEADATGFVAGLYGFNSFGLYSPFEIVLTYDIYAGSCRYDDNDLTTDVSIKPDRKLSVDFGLSLGVGVQYEPWDVAVVVKFSPFISEKNYKGEHDGIDRSTNAAIMGGMMGVEIIFSIPDHKNNITE